MRIARLGELRKNPSIMTELRRNAKFSTSRAETATGSRAVSRSPELASKARGSGGLARLQWDTSVQFVKGVGPKLLEVLARAEIHTVGELLLYFPRAYLDRRAARNIASLKNGDHVELVATIHSSRVLPRRGGVAQPAEVRLMDDSGEIVCRFFRIPFRGYLERLRSKSMVRVVGKVTIGKSGLEFVHPELHLVGSDEPALQDQLLPVYSEIGSLTTAKLARLIQTAISQLSVDAWPQDLLPESLRLQAGLPTLAQALRSLHQPAVAESEQYLNRRSLAHKRWIMEDFFWLQLRMLSLRAKREEKPGFAIDTKDDDLGEFAKMFPFPLTQGQITCMQEIAKDLSPGIPMQRLLQGEVGSGKTLVAAWAIWLLLRSKRQVALMVPTEILCEQHVRKLSQVLGAERVLSLSGRLSPGERDQVLEKLSKGDPVVVVGTQALLGERVMIPNLGLAIIDEQHRFGVWQRAELLAKGVGQVSPHLLLLTATPIPRTLALAWFGDVSVSSLKELPKGRKAIRSRVVRESFRERAYDFLLEQVKLGRQAFVVLAAIEDANPKPPPLRAKARSKSDPEEQTNLTFEEQTSFPFEGAVHPGRPRGVETHFAWMKKKFPELSMDLLHGRMSPEAKSEAMAKFESGQTQVLVSTTVMEVGIDVPNASFLLVENAERFGLSQLHQLRGRVGRGEHSSFAIFLVAESAEEDSFVRVQVMETSSSGFELAEKDLATRGPGEFVGLAQAGFPKFLLASLSKDVELLKEARSLAESAMGILKKSESAEAKSLGHVLARLDEDISSPTGGSSFAV